MTLTQILFEPDKYFQENDPSKLEVRSIWFVVATALLSLLAGLVQTYAAGQAVPDASNLSLTILVVSVSITGLFTPFISWLIYTVLLFVVARLLGGESGFRSTTRIVAVGFLPIALGSAATLVATGVAINAVSVASIENVRQFVVSLNAHFANRFARGLNNLFLVWSGLVWVFGAREAHDLELWEACVASGVPVVVGVGLYFFG